MTYRRYDLDVPKELDDRIRKALDKEIERRMLRIDTSPREFLLALLMQGLALQELQQTEKERAERMVLTPQEMAESSERLRRLKRG